MPTLLKTRRSQILAVGLFAMLALIAACGEATDATPTLRATRTIAATSTPSADALTKTRVAELFKTQVSAIQRADWKVVYEVCSPAFRAARDVDRFVQDASSQFARDGYSTAGFEARNIDVFVRAPDRVRVKWDAYQDGRYIRTEEVGQTYVFTQGDWFDDGAWCR